jgi:cellulose synthase/poly-beta-1,6-N-acetylglucosamine synthase-like glycosyltransferase
VILLLTILASVTALADLLLIIFWQFNFRTYQPHMGTRREVHPELQPVPTPIPAELPHVAVLLAVRNEENYLPGCLDYLLASDYPADKITIWVGNDASEDATARIAYEYAARDRRVKVVEVRERLGDARAKANVLAHLALAAEAERPAPELFLVTDADMRVQPFWVRGMVQHWASRPKAAEVGVVTGITLVDGSTAWGQMQRIDWIFALGMVKVASDWGIPIATMGNNMLMHRGAYRDTGGYERLPFSITEDFQILHEICSKPYSFRNVIAPQVVAFTQPMSSWEELLQQRRRWMQGAVRLPFPIVALLSLQAVFYPLILLLAFFQPVWAALMLPAKILLQAVFIMLIVRKLRLTQKYRNRLYRYLIPYEMYAALLTPLTIIYYLLPVKTTWKGRKY